MVIFKIKMYLFRLLDVAVGRNDLLGVGIGMLLNLTDTLDFLAEFE